MGWRELRGWMRELNRQRAVEAGRDRTSPDSWDGYERDAWWQAMREERRRQRGY